MVNVHHVPGLCLLGNIFSLFLFFLRNHRQMVLLIVPEDSLNLGHHNLLKLYGSENPPRGILVELWFLLMRPLKIFFSKTTQQNS